MKHHDPKEHLAKLYKTSNHEIFAGLKVKQATPIIRIRFGHQIRPTKHHVGAKLHASLSPSPTESRNQNLSSTLPKTPLYFHQAHPEKEWLEKSQVHYGDGPTLGLSLTHLATDTHSGAMLTRSHSELLHYQLGEGSVLWEPKPQRLHGPPLWSLQSFLLPVAVCPWLQGHGSQHCRQHHLWWLWPHWPSRWFLANLSCWPPQNSQKSHKPPFILQYIYSCYC